LVSKLKKVGEMGKKEKKPEEIRNKIFKLIKDYYNLVHKPSQASEFVPGL
jgi:hypothetical protein